MPCGKLSLQVVGPDEVDEDEGPIRRKPQKKRPDQPLGAILDRKDRRQSVAADQESSATSGARKEAARRRSGFPS